MPVEGPVSGRVKGTRAEGVGAGAGATVGAVGPPVCPSRYRPCPPKAVRGLNVLSEVP